MIWEVNQHDQPETLTDVCYLQGKFYYIHAFLEVHGPLAAITKVIWLSLTVILVILSQIVPKLINFLYWNIVLDSKRKKSFSKHARKPLTYEIEFTKSFFQSIINHKLAILSKSYSLIVYLITCYFHSLLPTPFPPSLFSSFSFSSFPTFYILVLLPNGSIIKRYKM